MKKVLLLTLIVALSVTNVFAQTKISSRLMDAMNRALEDNAPVRALVMLDDRVDILALDQELYARQVDLQERAYTVITTLQAKADQTQPAVISSLSGRSSSELVNIERFWVANILLVEAIPAVLVELSQRSDVAYLDLDAELEWDRPVDRRTAPLESPNGIEPGIAAINAPAMWAAGYTGAGTIVMNIDTGVDGNHVALNYKWRGAQPGVPASAAWYDAVSPTTFPWDCDGHGTHTAGTMNGLAPATHDTVGVAPGAQWIASNSLCVGGSHTSASIASFQWAMNPDGNVATSDDMPAAIGNSWYDPSISAATECNPAINPYINVITAVEASGIAVVFSAGNNGPGAMTVTQPKNVNIGPVHFWATGAVDGNNPSYPITSYSSRGPVVPACSTGVPSLDIKPEASAPGDNVRSSTPGNTYSFYSGTSMACPHVVGAIALLREAHPTKTGLELKQALYETAVDLGTPGEDNSYGMGIIDVYAAHLSLADPTDPEPPTNFVATSGPSTPTSMLLTWTDPSTYVNGSPLTNFNIIIARDGAVIDSVNSGVQTFTNTNLTQYQEYMYEIWAKDNLDSTSSKASATWMAGGYAPVMVVSPESIYDTMLVGGVSQHQMTIFNNQAGPGPLNYTITENPSAAWLSVSQTSGTVNPGSSVVLNVDINSAGLTAGLHTTDIVVSGNDPFNPQETILVSLLANEPPIVGFTPDSLVFYLSPNEEDSSLMILTNSGTGPLYFTLSDEDLSAEYIIKKKQDLSYLRDEFDVELSKDQDDWRRGTPQTEGAGGPDLYGYTWIDSDEPGGPVPNYIDISGTGTILTFTSMDDATALLNLPFNVEFYGQSYNQLRVCTNGWISFTTSYTGYNYTNTQIPSATDPDNLIAILWDDLNGNNPNSHVYYQQIGNKFIIQFHNWNRYGHTGGNLNFQYVLYQNNETIEFQYATINFGTGSNPTGHTIGIENLDGTDGLQVVFNAAYIHNNMSIKFATESQWLSENPTSGSIPPGGSMDVQVIANSTGLLGGVHRAQVLISSNDPVTPETGMPVRLTVSGIPDISLSPDMLTFDTLLVGATQDLTFNVANTGTFPLTVSAITSTNAAFSANPTAFAVAPLTSSTVAVTFAPLAAGVFEGWMVVASDDPDSPLDSVHVIGHANDAPVVGISPDSLHFDLSTGQVDSQVVVISNTGAGPLTFDLTDEDILGENISLKMVDRSYIRPEYNVEIPKDQSDWRVGTPQTEGTGGPDLYGYTWIDSDEPGGPVFNWIDISSTGTAVTGLADDNHVGPFPIGFTLNFYGNEYTEFYVQSNGLINFDNTYLGLSNYQIPLADSYNNLIAWLWDDLDPGNALTHVYYQTMGNMLVIQFQHYFEYPDGGAWVDAEMILYGNGNIKIQYDYFDPAFDKLGCTVGIENSTGTDGLQVAYNGPYLHDDLALLFSLESQWLSENPTSGIIPPGGSVNVQVIADATGMFGGDYLATVVVNSNDPVNPAVELPRVSLTVTGVPVITTTPASLVFDSTFVGLTPSQELLVANDGTDQLVITSITSTDPVFSVDTTHFNLGPLSNMPITIIFAPVLPGNYDGWIVIASNDAGNPLDSTHVMAVGIEAPVAVVVPNFQNPVFVPLGDSVDVSINLANAGGSNMMWSASTAWQPMVLEKKVQLPVYGPKEPAVNAEVSPMRGTYQARISIETIWDLQFSFDLDAASGSVYGAGAEFDGTYYYTTEYSGATFHKFDLTGTQVEPFSIPGVSSIRDLAFDGTYMYGGAAGTTIYMMDFVSKTLVGQIPSPVAVRNIAYDAMYDAFWVGDWATDLVLVDRSGNTLASISAATHGLISMYGSAYDHWTDGGPYLWVFDQGPLGDSAILQQFNLTTLAPTGVTHNVGLDFPAVGAIAGGLFTAEGIVSGKVSIGGVIQGTPDIFFVYELAEAGPAWMRMMMTSGMVAPGDNSDMPMRIYGMEEGSDTAFVVIQTNDPSAPVINIEVHKTMVTGLEDLAQMPTTFDILQNYPNPFNPTTTIKYQLPMVSDVKLVIYNVLGQQVRTLLNGQIEAGYHSVVWDGRNETGQSVASGIYIYRFEADNFQKTMKLMLLK